MPRVQQFIAVRGNRQLYAVSRRGRTSSLTRTVADGAIALATFLLLA